MSDDEFPSLSSGSSSDGVRPSSFRKKGTLRKVNTNMKTTRHEIAILNQSLLQIKSTLGAIKGLNLAEAD